MENNQFETLKRNVDFIDLKKNGYRLWATQWLLFNYLSTDGPCRVGMTISRKVGSSVVRNRLKRWSREIIRQLLIKGETFNGDINIIFKPMPSDFYKGITFKVYSESLLKGWARIRKSPSTSASRTVS